MKKRANTGTGRKRVRKHSVPFWIFIAILILIVAYFIANGISNRFLDVRNYEYHTGKIKNRLRVVLITDLHSREYGRDNGKLISKIENLSPDIIAMAGDMVLFKSDKNDSIYGLCESLLSVAPVYYSLGNHEMADSNRENLLDTLDGIGVSVLDNRFETLQIKGDTLCIGGITEFPSLTKDAADFLAEYEALEGGLKLLLCHHPEFYLWGMKEWNVDLIFAGHAHGGQIRIPGIGALYAPDQGFFPKYADGMHTSDKNTMIVSRGAGNSSLIPRVNNRPEIVCVDLLPE